MLPEWDKANCSLYLASCLHFRDPLSLYLYHFYYVFSTMKIVHTIAEQALLVPILGHRHWCGSMTALRYNSSFAGITQWPVWNLTPESFFASSSLNLFLSTFPDGDFFLFFIRKSIVSTVPYCSFVLIQKNHAETSLHSETFFLPLWTSLSGLAAARRAFVLDPWSLVLFLITLPGAHFIELYGDIFLKVIKIPIDGEYLEISLRGNGTN